MLKATQANIEKCLLKEVVSIFLAPGFSSTYVIEPFSTAYRNMNSTYKN